MFTSKTYRWMASYLMSPGSEVVEDHEGELDAESYWEAAYLGRMAASEATPAKWLMIQGGTKNWPRQVYFSVSRKTEEAE